MASKQFPTSDAAVQRATGKGWREWLRVLDRAGAKRMEHRDIVALVQKEKVPNGWWCQMVANGYERARQGRVIGKTTEVGFQIGVSKTVQASKRKVWQFLMSPRGLALWLGRGARLPMRVDRQYATLDGTTGEVRSVKTGERIRLSLRKGSKESTLQMSVRAASVPSRTRVQFHQEKLSSARERERMRTHWQGVLAEIAGAVEK